MEQTDYEYKGLIATYWDLLRGDTSNWPDRFFARIVDTYLARTGNAGGKVGDAETVLIDARGLLAFALPVMQAVAADASAVDRVLAS